MIKPISKWNQHHSLLMSHKCEWPIIVYTEIESVNGVAEIKVEFFDWFYDEC